MKYLKDIINGLRILEIKGIRDVGIKNIYLDSRKVDDSSLFVAVNGTVSDGHEFIKKAEKSGACAIVCEQLPQNLSDDITYIKVSNSSEALSVIASNFYNNPSKKLKLVGITGTNGKTTSATLLYNLFCQLGYKSGLISTVNTKVQKKTYPSTHTTPDVITLNKILKEMADESCTHVFMEVSSHALDQNRTSGLDFDIGVFTNISRDHLDYHSTFNNYLNCKKKLFDSLSNEALAIINFDDHYAKDICKTTNAKVLSYGIKGDRFFKGKLLENDISGLTLEIDGVEMISRLIGEFNIYNLLVAYSVAKCLGEDKMTILTVLSNVKAPEGRFEYFISDSKITSIVDYAHTPDALENVLKTLKKVRKKNEKIFTVFGCGGDRDRGKRPLMGKIAASYSDYVIITSDNPRSEDPDLISKEIYSGIVPSQEAKVLSIIDRKEAIKVACTMAKSGDMILVAGKGHEKYQIKGNDRIYFDDLEVLTEFFNNNLN